MLWAVFNTSCTVGIFSIRISFPFVLNRIIPLHWWAFLFTNPVVIKVFTGLIIIIIQFFVITNETDDVKYHLFLSSVTVQLQ